MFDKRIIRDNQEIRCVNNITRHFEGSENNRWKLCNVGQYPELKLSNVDKNILKTGHYITAGPEK